MLTIVIIVVLLFLLAGALPTWPYSVGWGPYPAGLLGFVVIIILLVWLLHRPL